MTGDERTPEQEPQNEQEDLRRQQGEFLQSVLDSEVAGDLFEMIVRAHETTKGNDGNG